ncbi:MAG: hypothetical protein F4Z65_02730 [Acidobacteria bacterium]|nr:hypothetical protein [Acidobacteriota bacterium]MYA47419.1 hypothetical protein [Acidobacteriota bacterium]MYI39813.1 hypothetical protein [Acidobacteriota bacterium]
MVPRVPQVDQALVDLAEALRLPTIGERANTVASRLGERHLDAFVRIEAGPPAAGGFVAFPQGCLAPQARAGSNPRHRNQVRA